nr:hypothetical protein [Brucella anthropi]
MSQSPITVRLDRRRLDQLKAIGAAMSLSNAGAISAMIREKIAAGVIPDQIPGVVIQKVADGVSVQIDDGQAKTLTKEGALELAAVIRSVVAGDLTHAGISLKHGFAVERRGTGFHITVPCPGMKASFPADLALDIADHLEKAAA